ncbi:hypothetical protein D9611_001057 [Ephemerocybe angulata]|uniref:Uncharacterized protein n=1 Tax=Ephemerocybe angulata TaxID=980116 RepID=A0A8H5BNC6_9AGAR|nr:hypothetical protein D9611_001057 [Tulosesus angulatus]
MSTIPARLARVTRTSVNAAEAKHRIKSLYRSWYRSVSVDGCELGGRADGFALVFLLLCALSMLVLVYPHSNINSNPTPHTPAFTPTRPPPHPTVPYIRRPPRPQAPEIVSLYALSVSPAYVRHAIRQKFEQFQYATDPRTVDVLLLKSRQDYQETMNAWKQPDHVLGILLENPVRRERGFLEKFYEGRDEDASRPAATGVM